MHRAGYALNVYLDGEYKDTDINVEICGAVISKENGDGSFKDIPAITIISRLHRGAYDKLVTLTLFSGQTEWVSNRRTNQGELH